MAANIPEEILDNLELDIATYLMGDSWFGQARLLDDGTYVTIPVLTEDLGNIDILIQKAILTAGPGICLVVQALEWDIQYKNVPGPYIEKMDVNILGIENVVFNRGTPDAPSPSGTLKTIKSTLIRAQELLHLWTPPSLTRALVCSEARVARVGSQETGDAGIVQYSCSVGAAGGTGIAPLLIVEKPTFANLAGTVTLACGTPGACLTYSLDNSNPSPRNGLVYSGPFAVQPGQILKAQAWLTYWRTSEMLTVGF